MKTEEILKKSTENTLNINEDSPLHKAVLNAMKIYAEECVKASLEKASEKGCDSLELYNSEYETLKKAITNHENIILL